MQPTRQSQSIAITKLESFGLPYMGVNTQFEKRVHTRLSCKAGASTFEKQITTTN